MRSKPSPPPREFNFAYQLKRHVDMHLRQWPKNDPAQVRADITRRLRAGEAWLWPEPTQMELFA